MLLKTKREGRSISSIIGHIEENFFAVCRYWGSLISSFIQIDSIGALGTGVPVSDINWVFNEKPLNSDSAKDIVDIKKYYKKLSLRFWWWVYPCGQSPENNKTLQDANLELFKKVPCMAATLNDSLLDDSLADEIRVLQVKSKKDLLIWRDVSFEGFEMPDRARKPYGIFVSSFDLDEHSPQKLFIAYYDGKPVATSLLFIHKNTAGIYYVSTLPAYRNKGCGLRITQAAMQSAKKSGFKDVILQATPMGERLYKKIGFKEHCQAEIYKLKKDCNCKTNEFETLKRKQYSISSDGNSES
jgi:N-acetylglutamate synthase-like GNAT family acetyltransferase